MLLNEFAEGLSPRDMTQSDEFASLSKSAIGQIKRANQGVIVVQARDAGDDIYEPHSVDKRVRAVATVDYYLAQR